MGRHIFYQCKLVTCHLGHGDMGDEGVELVGGVLILVPQPGEAHAHPEGGAAHPLRPDGLVQPGVNAHVRCAHLLLSKLFNLLKKNTQLKNKLITRIVIFMFPLILKHNNKIFKNLTQKLIKLL